MPAMAQQAQQSSQELVDEEQEEVERVTVTGSRIARIGDIAPTPVTVISGDGLVDAGVNNVADLLHELPSTLVGLSPETTNNTIFASGLNNTDLRGLGSDRTLVLVNGRRFIAGAPGSGAVDLNNIPTAMVERIEITTGGASAVYGSDAIAGVVNVITKKDFEGAELDVSVIRPFEDGGDEEFASITFGSSFDKASFVTNLSVTKSGQLSAMDREFLREAPIVLQNPEAAENPDDDTIPRLTFWGLGQQVLAAYSETSDFTTVFGDKYNYTPDGTLKPFSYGEPLPYPLGSGRQDYLGGDGYNFSENTYYRTPLDRINFTTHFTYELNRDHAMHLEVNYSKTDAYGEGSPAFLGFTVRPDNAFLTDEAQAIVQSDFDDRAAIRAGTYPGLGAIAVGQYTSGSILASDFGNRQYTQDRTLARASLSFEGSLGAGWIYDAYATVGHVQSDTEWYGELFEDRFYQAIDAVEVDGQIQCRDTSNGCVPLNIFGSEQFSDEAYDWVSTDAIRRASIGQTVLGATVTGDLYDLPAGPLATAFSVEYREEKSSTLPDPAMRAGLLFNNISSPLDGEYDVSEAAIELSIPVVADMAFADLLTIETAYRYMDYSTSGSDDAWKVGVNWAVNEDLRVRASRSKSVRAPNIGELYSPPGQTFASYFDVCDSDRVGELSTEYRDQIRANCAADGVPADFSPSDEWYGSTRPGFNVGNPDLSNEVAKDVTAGFVFTPSFVENLSLTVDYWDFEITNAISAVGVGTAVNLCYRSSSIDNPYCDLIERDPETFEIVNFFQRPVNAAYSQTSGYDIETAYRLSTDVGIFDFRLIGTYLDERISNSTGLAEDEIDATGEQARPEWRHRLITSYQLDNFSAVLSMTYRASTVLNNEWTPNQNDYNDVPSYTQFDLTTRYNVTPELQLRAGLLNMFDKTPPRRPGMYNQGAYYDLLGRRATLGINYSF
ncbi:MAG: TonB-dependent receptor [Idiomarina sp.]|nr:TonB-dependent receptor [Idiomarina sp.]